MSGGACHGRRVAAARPVVSATHSSRISAPWSGACIRSVTGLGASALVLGPGCRPLRDARRWWPCASPPERSSAGSLVADHGVERGDTSPSRRCGTSVRIVSTARGGERRTVGTFDRERRVDVGDGQDSHWHCELMCLVPTRVAAAVETLVMRAGDWREHTEAGTRSRICSPSSGCLRIMRQSASESGPGLSRTRLEIDNMPMSCNRPARPDRAAFRRRRRAGWRGRWRSRTRDRSAGGSMSIWR